MARKTMVNEVFPRTVLFGSVIAQPFEDAACEGLCAVQSNVISSPEGRLPPSPAPSLERLAFLQNSTGFSSNICQVGNEHTLRKLWAFEDHLNIVRSPFSNLSLHLLLPSPKKSGAATWHLPLSLFLINYKLICVSDFFNVPWFPTDGL